MRDDADLQRQSSVVYLIQRYATDLRRWIDWSAIYHSPDDLPQLETELNRLRVKFSEDLWRPIRRESSVWESLIE